MNTRELESLREQFSVGARVVLEKMDDVTAPPIGTKGTVVGVDDIGSIMVQWDNGSSLSVVYGKDICKLLNYVKVINYGKERIFDNRQDAVDFYEECLLGSEGAERERYLEILIDLRCGKAVCRDEKESKKD